MSQNPYSLASLRANSWHFVTGRLLAGLLSFSILLLLVRALPVAEFGVYVSLVAGMELAIGVAGLGLPWIVARYLPELRLQGARADLVRFLRVTTVLTAFALAVVAGGIFVLLWVLPGWGSGAWGAHRTDVFVFLCVGFLEGLARHLRDNVLGGLMLQARARLCLALRQGLLLGGLLTAAASGSGQLAVRTVVFIECAACFVALTVCALQVVRAVRQLPESQTSSTNAMPSIGAMWSTGLRMYAAHLVSQPYQPAALLLLVQQFSGLQQAALFGFLKSIYEQLCRYLPTALLSAVIRPKLMAAAVGGASRAQMLQHAAFISRLGLLAATPVLALAAVAGPEALRVLSGGRLEAASPVLVAMAALAVLYGRRQLLEVCAVAVGASTACVVAATLSLAGVLLALGLFFAGAGVWGAIAGLACGQVVFTVALQRLLLRGSFDVDGLLSDAKVLLIGAGAAAGAAALTGPGALKGIVGLSAQGLLCVLVVVLLAWRFSPFTPEDRARINAFLGRRLLP